MEDRNLLEEMVESLDDTGKMMFVVLTFGILEPYFAERLKEETEKLK